MLVACTGVETVEGQEAVSILWFSQQPRNWFLFLTFRVYIFWEFEISQFIDKASVNPIG